MITLLEAKVGMADKVDQMVIDEFRRGSFLLDALIFDNAVSPGTGGSTLVYGYIKLLTPSSAGFRALNTEYTNNEAKRIKATAELKIFGGNFKIDRVIINTSGVVDELNFQLTQKIKASINLFHYSTINGDSALNEDEFDGLDVILSGSSTEYNTGSNIDLSTSASIDTNYNEFLDMMNTFLSKLSARPDMLLMNSDMKVKMSSVARRAKYLTQSEDAFGRPVECYNGIPMVDLEYYYDGNKTVPCVPIDPVDGTTSIFAVKIALDGFHGVSPLGGKVINTTLPNLKEAGVMKEGDVEMVAAVVLKDSRKAGVFRNIKIAPVV